MTSPIPGERSITEHIILADDIARDIVAQWTQQGLGMNPMRRPGVWLVREALPEQDPETGKYLVDAKKRALMRPATAEERREMWAADLAENLRADRAYADYLIETGDMIDGLPSNDPRKQPGISELMRKACDFYGVKRKWSKALTTQTVQACPMCQTVCSREAIICSTCGWPLDVATYKAMLDEQRKLLGENAVVPSIKGGQRPNA